MPNLAVIESLALRGDISGLTPAEKVQHYATLCGRLGLDATTQPFLPLKLNGKEVLYAARSCTDQLARLYKVNRAIVSRERIDDVYVVTARATLPDGRAEESVGAVAIGNSKGEQLANMLMKAETKAKRRVTLSICGLAMLDESELDTIPSNQMVSMEPINITPGNQATVELPPEKPAEQQRRSRTNKNTTQDAPPPPPPPPEEKVKSFDELDLDPEPKIDPNMAKIMFAMDALHMTVENLNDWLESKQQPKLDQLPPDRLAKFAAYMEEQVKRSQGAA
jgi:hypothetical protein